MGTFLIVNVTPDHKKLIHMLAFLCVFFSPKIIALDSTSGRKCGGSHKKYIYDKCPNVSSFGIHPLWVYGHKFLMIVCMRLINLLQIFHRLYTSMYSRIFIIIRILCVLYGLYQIQQKKHSEESTPHFCQMLFSYHYVIR